MPMVGWICVHMIVEYFSAFEKIYSVDRHLSCWDISAGHMIYESVVPGTVRKRKQVSDSGALMVRG